MAALNFIAVPAATGDVKIDATEFNAGVFMIAISGSFTAANNTTHFYNLAADGTLTKLNSGALADITLSVVAPTAGFFVASPAPAYLRIQSADANAIKVAVKQIA